MANERLIPRAFAGNRDDLVIATKFGIEITDEGAMVGMSGTPAYARRALERSLRHLQTDCIDLYYVHCIDPNVPIEGTIQSPARDGNRR